MFGAGPAAHARQSYLVPFLLLAASASFTLWRNTQVGVLVDISYLLNTATRIAAGDVPYAQFPLVLAPFEFLAQGLLIKAFGPHFFVQIAYATILGGLATALTYAIARRLLGTAVARPRALAAILSIPLVPLGIFRHRNLSAANVIGILWAAAMFALFFISALYLQLVLGYSPLAVGLAFLPGNLLMMAFSLGVSAKLVMRYGYRGPLALGLATAALALLWLARAPVHGSFVLDVLPSMLLIGIGGGLTFNPVLMAAMSERIGQRVAKHTAAAGDDDGVVDVRHVKHRRVV